MDVAMSNYIFNELRRYRRFMNLASLVGVAACCYYFRKQNLKITSLEEKIKELLNEKGE